MLGYNNKIVLINKLCAGSISNLLVHMMWWCEMFDTLILSLYCVIYSYQSFAFGLFYDLFVWMFSFGWLSLTTNPSLCLSFNLNMVILLLLPTSTTIAFLGRTKWSESLTKDYLLTL